MVNVEKGMPLKKIEDKERFTSAFNTQTLKKFNKSINSESTYTMKSLIVRSLHHS